MEDKFTHRTTNQEDWAVYYGARTKEEVTWQQKDDSDFRNRPHLILVNSLKKFVRGDIIEVGAGDSDFLIDLYSRYRPNRAVGLDYLPEACELLRHRAGVAGADIETACADLYLPPSELVNQFDLAMSFGVVEHFTDLSDVVNAISQFAKPSGVVFTMIPNVKGSVYQWLMRRWNRKVYEAHVPYDDQDLMQAHRDAGLKIEVCEYVVSSNFGMLSWCFADQPKAGLQYRIYVWLTRLSKFGWWFEKRFFPLPSTRWFASYIICIARKD